MAASDPVDPSAYDIHLISHASELVSAAEGHRAAGLLVEMVDERRRAAGETGTYASRRRLVLARNHAVAAEQRAWGRVRAAGASLRAWGWEHGADREVVLGQIEPLYLSEDDKNEIVSLCTEWSASLAGRESGAQAATD